MRLSLAAFSVIPALLLAQLPLPSAKAQQSNQLAAHAKPAVVRILTGCSGVYRDMRTYDEYPFIHNPQGRKMSLGQYSSGTGFFISSDGYLVTNAHVVENSPGSEQQCKDILRRNLTDKLIKDEGLAKETIDSLLNRKQILLSEVYYANYVILPNTNADNKLEPFLYEIKERGSAGDKGGKDVAILKIEVKNAPVLPLLSSAPSQSQPIVVIGYPGAADINTSANSTSLLEATITEGIVSNPNKTLENGSSVLQVDVRVEPGSSGSPVLNEQGEVIGIIALNSVADGGASRIPFAIPTSTIQEYARASGAVNQMGLVDSTYREGLERFLQKDYAGAKIKFQSVISLFPQHSEANRLIRETDQKISEMTSTNTSLPLVAGLGVAVAGLLAAYFIVRRRSAAPVLAGDLSGIALEDDVDTRFVRNQRSSKSTAQPMTVLSSERRQPATVIALQPSLELKNAQEEEVHFVLRKDRHQLGRDRTWADLKVPDEGWEVLSKRHATLERDGEGYRIYDGDRKGNFSTNGIAVNGLLISPEGHLLKDGDRLTIGQDPHNQVDIVYHTVSRSSAPRSEASYRDGNG
ncbi:MAG TPA: trypsin-like peptidase domain-containing protein [Coleofasciculaceae cyanobacterium]